MPYLKIETNVEKTQIPKGFVEKTCGLIAKPLDRPLNYCVVTVVPDLNISVGGSYDPFFHEPVPCAKVTLTSIAQLEKEKFEAFCTVLFKHINNDLKISPNKIHITYKDAPTTEIVYQSITHCEEFDFFFI